MSRKVALAHIRVAGYHGDKAAFTRSYIEARLSYRAADQAYVEGARARKAGVPCSCIDCRSSQGSE